MPATQPNFLPKKSKNIHKRLITRQFDKNLSGFDGPVFCRIYWSPAINLVEGGRVVKSQIARGGLAVLRSGCRARVNLFILYEYIDRVGNAKHL